MTSTSAPTMTAFTSSYSCACLGRRARAATFVGVLVFVACLCGLAFAAAGTSGTACSPLAPPDFPGEVTGFQMGNAGAEKKMEIYGDFQCPDTKAAWLSVIDPLLRQHKDHLSIVFHPFPLPYHHSAFDAAQAAMYIAAELPDLPFANVASALFHVQESYQTDATANISQRTVFSEKLAPVAVHLGIAKSTFVAHMRNSDPSNHQARVAWKYGAARGVYGTPTFAIDSVIDGALAAWSLEDWESWLATPP